MLLQQVHGDTLRSPYRHVAFAANTEGSHNAGFAGMVANRFWPGLANIGPLYLGQTLSRKVGGRVFHALVCHTLEPDGFRSTPRIIIQCLDALAVPADQVIACVKIGDGPLGRVCGADVPAILRGIDRSNKRVMVYWL